MVARTKAIPSPVGGWNARDSYADMPPTDAVLLENWFPSEGAVNLRKGYSNHQTGLGDWVETLMVYHNGTTEQLLAAADGNIRNVTSGTTSLASGFSENKWQYATLGGTMGLVNGTDAPRTYDGSTLGTMTLTGPTAANVIGVAVHGSRSYFWEDDSQSFWYSALNTMGGTVTEFDLGNVANIAGELVEVTNWTHDGGDGADDYLVFLFSEGDVLIYQGTDPGSAADFAKIGAYRIAQPLGRRCAMSLGGDVVLMTTDGYVLLSEV
ncbi:MAG: hypothetical protein ACPG6R_11980, partial [Aequoribacter sp.]|uniref:hypothetical protein n=1 Tax=Aequoribacter sp. TaxID=2847771 RepID=UPI003C51D629